mmetsp:Transcript_25114/g.38679  ORF Transcript_25114/g.38679 Transcript_25114/m.38679 type:complete len:641 (-) Transcript_25114:528-2450(-)
MAGKASTKTKKSSSSSRPCPTKALNSEAKSFLDGKSPYPHPARSYEPTLDEFRKVSFSDFVRNFLFQDGIEPKTTFKEEEEKEEEEKKEGQSETDNKSDTEVTATKEPKTKKEPVRPRRMNTRNSRSQKLHKDNLPDPRLSTKWSDGMAKITLPEGWWDKAGIGKDMTARGPNWQRGTRLGDVTVEGPIKQCISGIGGVYEFSLMNSPSINICDFRDKADAYRKRQVGKEFDDDYSDDNMAKLERRFWKRLGPTMEPPFYGADMDGSFFDGDSACGWNVESLESCLQLLTVNTNQDNLPGVTSPYLYFGMWGSVFCAHTEDMNLLSINYLHAGAPKMWYAISPEDSKRFESLAQSHFAQAAQVCPEFLRHKRCLLSPAILRKAGIMYTTQIQRPGDAMITFPGSYHFGFNTGFNIAESTNFAVPEWIPSALEARVCMCHPHSVRIDMKQFQALLDRYEKDNEKSEKCGRGLSYREWIMMERKKRRRVEESASGSDTEEESLTVTNKKQFIVEVVQPLPHNNNNNISSSSSTKRSTSKKTSKKRIKEDWRLAVRGSKASILPRTKVLCFITDQKGSTNANQCFAGTVDELMDGHARIHFAGLRREEDIWVALTSPKIFLDGGAQDPEAYAEKHKASKKRTR